MADEKIANLVIRLRNKTIHGGLIWEKTAEEGVFSVSLANYSINIAIETVSFEGERYNNILLTIYDNEGVVIEEITDSDLKENFSNSYSIMDEIYTIARRQAMGVEKAIDIILSELKDPDEIPF